MSTNTYLPDLNTLFARTQELGLACDLSLRVTVCEVTYPKIGYSVKVLVDYNTRNRAPGDAGYYAIAAEVLFESLSAARYTQICRMARQSHPATALGQKQAMAYAAKEMILFSHGVCIFRDEKVMAQLSSICQTKALPFDALAIAALAKMKVYAGARPIDSSRGPVTPEMVALQIKSTLAEGLTCVTEERLAEAVAAGPHPSRRVAA